MIEFQALYERYAKDVFRFALYLTGNRAHAEDITSETFVRAWVSSDKIRTATVKAYLFAIARNLHRMLRRTESRRAELVDCLADPDPGPADIAGNRLDLAVVLNALQKLPEVDRAAILMRAQDGMSHEEVATVLGLSVVAVKVKIHRARLKLKSLIGERKELP